MRTRKNVGGFTLTEMMTVMAIVGFIVFTFLVFFRKNLTFYKRSQMRQQVTLDSHLCMDAILQNLRNARSSTVRITTRTLTPLTVPNSQIDFATRTPLPSGADLRRIYLSTGTVFIDDHIGGAWSPNPKMLASNVKALMFTGDPSDPTVIKVTLHMESRLNASNEASHVVSVILPNQEAHLVETAAP